MPDKKPKIEVVDDGPYFVKGLKKLNNSKGENLPVKITMILCRCGQSKKKPYCDGTHNKINFSGAKQADRQPDRMDHYKGKKITVHDNRGVCSHAGLCSDNLKEVFRLKTEPWIDPDGADAKRIAEVIKMCPSGALSYTTEDEQYKDQKREAAINVSKDGPYEVEGGVELCNSRKNRPESKEHYTLCRCGASTNKPFCDGAHWSVKFKDEKN